MTANRDRYGRAIRPAYGEILTGRSVRGGHGVDAALLGNLLETEGGVSFSLDDINMDVDGTGTTIRTRALVRRHARRAIYLVEYDTPAAPGRVKLTLSKTPVNVADAQWADGQWVDVLTTDRRHHRPLVFYEVRDDGEYTFPSTTNTADLEILVQFDGADPLRILGIRCIELPARRVTEDTFGADLEAYDSRRPIFSSGSASLRGGLQQLRRIGADVATYGVSRFLFAHYAEPIATDADHTYSNVWPGKVRVHPPQRYARDPGWSYVPVHVAFYGSNSSAGGGGRVQVVSEYDATGIEIGGFATAGSYSWVSDVINCYCEAGHLVFPWESGGFPAATPSVRGFQAGHSAGADNDAESADRTSAGEDGLTISIKGKVSSGDAANTFTLRGAFVAFLGG